MYRTAELLLEHKDQRELWLAYRGTIFRTLLERLSNARDMADVAIAAGIALEDLDYADRQILGQEMGSLEIDHLKPN